MPVFEYTALNAKGRKVKGYIDADSIRAARSKLKQQGIFATTVAESEDKKTGSTSKFNFKFESNRVNTSQLAIATRQLSTLVGAGIPLVECLKALVEQLEHARLKRVFSNVADKVTEGDTFSNAMKEYPKVFPRLYVNMIASGEASGTLDMVMDRLADLLEKQAELRSKIISASLYPILMLLLCVGVVMLLLAYVVPEMTSIFDERKAVLPLPTRIVVSMSDFVQTYWWVMIGLAALFLLGLKRYASTTTGRFKIDTVLLRIPVLGPILLKSATTRFARTLGTMLASGIPLLSALQIVKNIVGNVVIEDIVENSIEGVREGRDLATELKKGDVLPKLLTHMVAIGERTGDLEPMLLRVAGSYETEVNSLITGLTKLLEPLLILFLAVVVGGILLSVMLPMLEMSSLTLG